MTGPFKAFSPSVQDAFKDALIRYGISEAGIDDLVTRRVRQLTPRKQPGRAAGQPPRVVIVSGQAGSRKSTWQNAIWIALGADRVVAFDGDEDFDAYPWHLEIQRRFGSDAQSILNELVHPSVHNRILEELRASDTKPDIVVSDPMCLDEWARYSIDAYRRHGYRVAVVSIATNPSQSLLAIALREAQQYKAHGRARQVSVALHDATLAFRTVAHDLEAEGYPDDGYVINADGYVVFENHLRGDGMVEMSDELDENQRVEFVGEAIDREWALPPTPAQHLAFRVGVRQAWDWNGGNRSSEPPVRALAEEAWARELRRPAPEPDPRVFTPADRIDRRLAVAFGRSPADGDLGVDPALIAVREVAGSGLLLPGAGTAQTADPGPPHNGRRPGMEAGPTR